MESFEIYANPIADYVDLLPFVLHYYNIEFDETLNISYGGLAMFIEERQQEIMDTIKANGKIFVSEITLKYGISDESARRDLRMLEQKGLCKRTYGGAVLMSQVSVRPPCQQRF